MTQKPSCKWLCGRIKQHRKTIVRVTTAGPPTAGGTTSPARPRPARPRPLHVHGPQDRLRPASPARQRPTGPPTAGGTTSPARPRPARPRPPHVHGRRVRLPACPRPAGPSPRASAAVRAISPHVHGWWDVGAHSALSRPGHHPPPRAPCAATNHPPPRAPSASKKASSEAQAGGTHLVTCNALSGL